MSNDKSSTSSSPNGSSNQGNSTPSSSSSGGLGGGTGDYVNPSWVSTRTEVPFVEGGSGFDGVGGNSGDGTE